VGSAIGSAFKLRLLFCTVIGWGEFGATNW
jgi:hypothetical protein